MKSSRAAFTLVELSIVLVILGLLVGGVLSGQSLIRAAELRAVGREFQQYQTALGAFKDKYFALPGDMTNAVKYWGAADNGSTADGRNTSCSGLTYAQPSADMKTCNGNGNGQIGDWWTNAATDYYEMTRAWQQLANAGLVEGSYTGVMSTASCCESQPGKNVPRSRVANAGWTLLGAFNFGNPARWFTADYRNILFFGGYEAGNDPVAPILKPEEAYNVDMKIDDGNPGKGRILSFRNSYRPDCATASDAAYDLAKATPGCTLLFITGY